LIILTSQYSTLMKRSVLLIGNELGDVYYRSLSKSEAESKLLLNTRVEINCLIILMLINK